MNLPDALAWLTAHVNLETGIGVPVGIDRRRLAHSGMRGCRSAAEMPTAAEM